ncbi:MAG: hypothetical protein ACXQTM_03230, partial [Methanosarcinales archaeon]
NNQRRTDITIRLCNVNMWNTKRIGWGRTPAPSGADSSLNIKMGTKSLIDYSLEEEYEKIEKDG